MSENLSQSDSSSAPRWEDLTRSENLPRDEWDLRREENTARLRAAVCGLERQMASRDYNQIWSAVKETLELFRQRPLEREEQPQLWDRFQKVQQTLDAMQDANVSDVENALLRLKEQYRLDEMEARASVSQERRGFDRLYGIEESIDFGAIWKAANDVNSLLHGKELMRPRDRQRLRDEINAYRDRLRFVEDLCRRRHQGGDDREREEVDRSLDRLEHVVGSREFNEERRAAHDLLKSRRSLSREARDSLWHRYRLLCRRDVEARIVRLEERIQSQEEYRQQKREQRQKLEVMLEEARSVDYESRVREWIEEADEKLAEVDDSIRKLREQIDSLRDRLNHP